MRRTDRDAAFTAYVEARRGHLRRLAFALCGDWHRAEDLLQTTLTKLYVAWPRLQRQGAEDAYARRILVTSNIDEGRRPWRRERPGLDGIDEPIAGPTGVETTDALLAALKELPQTQRKVVVLRFWADLSVDATAAELGIAPGTVKAHTHRGLARLRELLGDPAFGVADDLERT